MKIKITLNHDSGAVETLERDCHIKDEQVAARRILSESRLIGVLANTLAVGGNIEIRTEKDYDQT